MKALGLVFTALMLTGTAAAQTAAPAPEPHGVSVVKARWQKRFHNPALDEDPLRGIDDARELERERKETQRINTILLKQGRTQIPLPSQSVNESVRIPPNKAMNYYLYEVKLSNTGAKKIRSLVWAYVLYDATAAREVGSHSFETKVSLGAGKSKSLTGLSTKPPATVVDVSKSARETKPGQYAERVEIHRVEYEDGTVWERGKP